MTACSQHSGQDTAAMQSVEFQCSICFELMVDPVVGTCGHAFCKRCMDDWKASRQRLGQTVSCPQCRTNLLPASSTQQFGVCIRLRETISKLFPLQSAARRHEVEEWDKQAARDEERARSSADTSTSTAPAVPAAAGSTETMEAYRELTRRVLAALVTTNPEAAAEAVGLLPSPRVTQRAPLPAEQEQEARQRYASLQSSMALLTGALDVATFTSLPQTPNSRERSPTTPPAVRAQEQAAQQAQQQARASQQQAQAAQQQQQQQANLQQAAQQHQQPYQQAQAQATAPRQSAADATRERQVQAVRRQQQAHELRGVQLARLLASLIAEGTDAQAQQQQQAQHVAQSQQQQQQTRIVTSNQRSTMPPSTVRAQHTQQQAQQTSQHRLSHARQHAAPRTSDAAQVSTQSRIMPQGPAYQCPALAQRVHAAESTAAQHHRRQQQQQHYHAQQQQWAASQSGWVQYDNAASLRSGYPCMMHPMLVPANSSWPYVVSLPVSYTMYG